MIQKAIDILKARWPEVMLVVVLQAALMIFSDQMVMLSETMTKTPNEQIPFGYGFLLGIGTVVSVTVWMMLYLGFLKTSALEGVCPKQPMELVHSGRPYFWKLLFFQIVFGFAMVIFSSVIVSVMGGFIWKTADPTKIPQWFAQAGAMAVVVLFFKPMLFIPAQIIVCDYSVMQAVSMMRQYRMGDINRLFGWMAGGVGVILVLTVLVGLTVEKTPLYYVLSGVHHLTFSLVFLLLTLVVVLWVQQHLDVRQAQFKEEQTQE